MGTEKKPDLLNKQAGVLADYFDTLADTYAFGQPSEAGILELSEELLDPKSLQPVADLIFKEMSLKQGPSTDKLMLLSEQNEMLASLCKEYYVIHNRHDRINKSMRALSGMKHTGSFKGAVINRIQQAGGAYTDG